MKKIVFFLILGSMLVSCGGNESDKYTGKWVDTNWKSDSRTLEITKKGKNKYVVVSSFDKKEKEAKTEKDNEDILIVGKGFTATTLKYDNGTEELRTLSSSFMKVDEELQKEIDTHIQGLISEVSGKWQHEVMPSIFDSYNSNSKEPTEVYTYDIKPSKEKNCIDMKVELKRAKDKGKIITSEGVFEVLSNGNIRLVKTIGKNTNFFANSFYTDINSIKRFKKLN